MLELLRKYRYPLLAGGLVLVALLFFSARLRRGPETTAFERLVLGAAGPLQGALAWLPRVLGDGGELERLREENRRLQSELARQEELRQENRRLSWLLALRDEVQAPTVAARVIAEDAANWSRTVVIDRGREHGIREGMPVLVVEGLVGRVIRTAPKQSRVLLLTDPSSAVAALDQQSRARGICRGDGTAMRFDYAGRDERIEAGNAVVTSGTGGVFPRGLIVGRISRVDRSGDGMFQGVSVAPVTDLGRLEEVLVLLREVP
jgi:rod shape-determining protein MreC